MQPLRPTPPWLNLAWLGRIGGPLAAVGLYWLLLGVESGLTDAGRAVAAVGCLMAAFWLTEAMPIAATALLPIVLFPLLGVLPIRQAAAPYANEYLFLFMGGFMLALAMERSNLHRRIALLTVLAIGTSPARLVAGVMIATAFLSMWLSNTATTLMMLPIGMSLASLLAEQMPADRSSGGRNDFAVALMLGIAFAASIGGMGTLVGTPPNLILAAFVKQSYGFEIGFGSWMGLAVPFVAVFLLIAWFMLTRAVFHVPSEEIPAGRELIRTELAGLGRTRRAEWIVLGVFLATATAWIVREPLADWPWFVARFPMIERVHDATIALVAALALFVIPVDLRRGEFALDWPTAQRLPWDILLLFGGGLSLAAAVEASGLTQWFGQQVAALGYLSPLALILIVTTTLLFLTEMTSNTATASAFIPILGGVALGLGMNPLLLLIPAVLAVNCAFMLPIATPPNAIVFASGQVTMRQMAKAGLWLNLIGLLLIVGLSQWIEAWFKS